MGAVSVDEAVFLQNVQSATYGFHGQADEIRNVVSGHRYHEVIRLLRGDATMPIKK